MKKKFLIFLLLIPFFFISCDSNKADLKPATVKFVNWNPFTIYVKVDDKSYVHTIYSESYMKIEGDFYGSHDLYIHSKDYPTEKKVTINVPTNGTIWEFNILYNPNEDTYTVR